MDTKIMVFGATGMLGHKITQYLGQKTDYKVYPVVRNGAELASWLPVQIADRIVDKVDVTNLERVTQAVKIINPQVMINCVGIIKQLPAAQDPLKTIMINALFPHQLAQICSVAGARMIHISTDCVFDGMKGNYTESDAPNPPDLYGRTKLLGEVSYPHCMTVRTSIIGHELHRKVGLIDWFLSQNVKIRGYTNAIYSGLPTIELAHVIGDIIVPNEKIHGLYHVSSEPISKYDLLKLVAGQYKKQIIIEPDGEHGADKSLDSRLFRSLTGYHPPAWPELIASMHNDYLQSPYH